MAGPSSSTLDELQKQLNELKRLVIDELRKGTNRDEDLVAELRQERTSLVAQIAQIKQVSAVQRPQASPMEGPTPAMLKFAAAIKDAAEEDGFLVVPTRLLGSPKLGNRILVRECYPMLWERLQQLHTKRNYTGFIITGQPGIGKTFWLVWLLIRLVKEGRPVLWHDTNGFYLFMEETVFQIRREEVCGVLGDLPVVKDGVLTKGQADSQRVLPVYLVDGQQPLMCAESWAVLAHSPNMSRYKDFLKAITTAPPHFMPPFELEELMQLRPWVLSSQEQLTEHEVLERFQMMGGVARDIFVDYAVVELLFDTALTNLDVSHITKADSAAQTFSAVSHQLIFITVPEWRTGDFQTILVGFRSLDVTAKIWGWAQSKTKQALCMELAAGVAGGPEKFTAMHEDFMHLFLPQGGILKIRPLDLGKRGRPTTEAVAAKADAVETIELPSYSVIQFRDRDVGQLQLDSEVPQYFKPLSRQYPAVDSFTSDGKLFNATLSLRHGLVPALVRTLQVMPEQVTPELYWVVGTEDALSGFAAGAMSFADKLTDAALNEKCPPDEPSADVWTTNKVLKWDQVPRKARRLLAKLRQYVMWLDYTQYAYAKPIAAAPPGLNDPSSQGQRSGALPSARGSAWSRPKQHPFLVHHFTSRPKSWCRCARRPVVRSTLHGSMSVLNRNTLLPKTIL